MDSANSQHTNQPTPEHIVATSGLETKRGVKLVLSDINIAIAPGEHTVVYGLNGCGKTTLLSTICGYMGYTAGDIAVFGVTYNKENVLDLRRDISFVSNSYFNRLLRHENAFNIVLSGLFGGLGERWDVRKEDVRHAKHLLKAFGMEKRGMYPYDMLSYGQQQRILIARALMIRPRLLVLDEATSGLDVLTRQYFLNTVRDIADEDGTTIICATHYAEEVYAFYRKGILMREGKIFADGPVKDVFTDERLTSFFGQEAHASWHSGRLQVDVGALWRVPRELWMRGRDEEV